jgi:hypothetical protein
MTTVHPSWVKHGGLPLEIMEGKHDDDLEMIQQACMKRVKSRFRPRQQVRLVDTGRVEFEGLTGRIVKPNQKTVSVDVDGHGVLTVPHRMLEIV